MQEVLLGKDVVAPDGTTLGTAADIELDLEQDKVWITVERQGRRDIVPNERIAGLTSKTILLEGWAAGLVEEETGIS